MAAIDRVVQLIVDEFDDANQIGDDWAATCAEMNFNDFDSISAAKKPTIFENYDFIRKLSDLSDGFLEILEEENQANFWEKLLAEGCSGLRLSVLLWFPLEKALAPNSEIMDLRAGAAAAKTLLLFFSIEGATVFSVFHPYLYQKCIDVIRHMYRLLIYHRADLAALKKANRGRGRGRGGRGRGAGRSMNDTTLEQNETSTFGQALTDSDKAEIEEFLMDDLDALCAFLSIVGLSGYSNAIDSTASLLRDLLRLGDDQKTEVNMKRCRSLDDFKNLDNVVDKVVALAHCLADEKHSFGGQVAYAYIVLPRLACWNWENEVLPATTSISSSLLNWRKNFILFCAYRARKADVAELGVILNVLENLFQRCPDRLEYRTKTAETVTRLLKNLPSQMKYDFIQRVHIFSMMSKIASRSFAVELVPLLLKELDFSDPDAAAQRDGGETDENAGDETLDRSTQERAKMKQDKKHRKKRASGSESDQQEASEDEEEQEQERKRKKTKGKKKVLPKFPRVEALPALCDIFARCCCDKAPSVRARALTHLYELICDDFPHMELLKKSFRDIVESEEAWEEDAFGVGQKPPQTEDPVLDIIVDNIDDTKASVRKNGVTALQRYLHHIESPKVYEVALKKMRRRCVDASLMVRKQAIESLNITLAQNKTTEPTTDPERERRRLLQECWLQSVLPSINDREESVLQMAAKLAKEMIIEPLSSDAVDSCTWEMLSLIEQQVNYRRLLLRSLERLASEKMIDQRFVKTVEKKLDTHEEHTNIIWMLLADLSYIFKMEPMLAFKRWIGLESGSTVAIVRYVAKVLETSCHLLTEENKKLLKQDIEHRIKNFEVATPHIQMVYLCLARLYDAVGESATGTEKLKGFGKKLLDKAANRIRYALRQLHSCPTPSDFDEDVMVRVVMGIGEVIQFSPELIDSCRDQLIPGLKIILASDKICHKISEVHHPNMNPMFGSRTTTPAFGISRTTTQQPTQAESGITMKQQSTAPGSQSTALSSQGQGVEGQVVPPSLADYGTPLLTAAVRACTVVTLGKIALLDDKVARDIVDVFVHQLRVNPDHVIRNNIVFVMCDLCIRYSQYAEWYSAIIAACLKDASVLVRKQTLEGLTVLLKEKFILWKGQVMFRFVATVLDEVDEIRDHAEYCMMEVLAIQYPDLLNNVVEFVYYLNDAYNSWKVMRDVVDNELLLSDSLKFNLCGRENREDRLKVYKFMLRTFDDNTKFATMVDLCKKVVKAVADGEATDMDFDDPNTQEVMQDMFSILQCNEMKLSMNPGRKEGNAAFEDEEEAPVVVQDEARKVITTTFRKGICQEVMPRLLQLRRILVSKRSALLKGLMGVFRTLVREHKEYVDAFFEDEESSLKKQILFDIARLEDLEKKKAEKKKRRSMRVPPTPARPPVAEDNVIKAPSAEQNDPQPQPSSSVESVTKDEEMTVEAAENVPPRDAADIEEPMDETQAGTSHEESKEENVVDMQEEPLDEEGMKENDDATILGRAISTPHHKIDEVTFANDALSAIRPSPLVGKPRNLRRKVSRLPAGSMIEDRDESSSTH